MAITTPVYTTRETIKRALDQGEVARNNRNIDRCIESASRNVEGLCHRIFYPHIGIKHYSWPDHMGTLPWRLWLEDNDLISLTSATSGGTSIPLSNIFLEPNTSGPPYTRVEINIGTSSSFGGGPTHQQNIALTGLWGWSDDQITAGSTTTALDATQKTVNVDAEAAVQVGVGSVLRLGAERMLVTERLQLDTGQTVGGAGLTASKGDTTLTVADGTAFEVDETILIDSERVLITEIAGNALTIERAFEGSASAAHASGTKIYAPRTLVVERGAVGSTATTHTSGATVEMWRVPPGLKQYVTAEAIHELMQEQTGWFRTMSASSIFGGTAKRAATVEALIDMREQTYATYGRKARTWTI